MEPAACTGPQAIHVCIIISQQNEALTGELQSLEALSGLLLYLASVASKVTVITTYSTAHFSRPGWHRHSNSPFNSQGYEKLKQLHTLFPLLQISYALESVRKGRHHLLFLFLETLSTLLGKKK